MNIIERIKTAEIIDIDLTIQACKAFYEYCQDEKTTEFACQIVIYGLQSWAKICDNAKCIWTDLIEAIGFYPYIDKYKEQLSELSSAAQIRTNFFKSKNLSEIYLHDEQKLILSKILNKKNLIVSAPTSFGKSLLIEEVIASDKYTNILIIQPTLALLDETRKKVFKYSNKYNLVITTTQPVSENKNIFLLTAERVMEKRHCPKLDLLIIDEFYKLSASRDDERSDVLNNAFYWILKMNQNCQFLLLGPNIEKISLGFEEKYNAEFIRSKYTLVANEIDNSNLKGYSKKDKLEKNTDLFNLLATLKDEQTIIFCSSPAKAQSLAKEFQLFCKQDQIFYDEDLNDLPISKWIAKNISENWCVNNCIKYKIGVHDASLPKYITSSIIKYFNNEIIRFLFCTTTIIEGVNTNAKNIVYFDNTKGKDIPIDYFDYCNIKGRAGRLMKHLVGKVYNFNKIPDEEQTVVDIPFFHQDPISDEILIHIEKPDMLYPETSQAKEILSIDAELKDLFRRNGVSVKGQQNIINILMKQGHLADLDWTGCPNYSQLETLVDLAWDNFIKPTETTSPMTKKKLVYQAMKYMHQQSLTTLIKGTKDHYLKQGLDEFSAADKAVQELYQIKRHWFEYKLPKWFIVIDSLQKYVGKKMNIKTGDYLYIASALENEFISKNLSLLGEYNLPATTIAKLGTKIPKTLEDNLVIDFIKSEQISKKCNLSEYEMELIQDNLFE